MFSSELPEMSLMLLQGATVRRAWTLAQGPRTFQKASLSARMRLSFLRHGSECFPSSFKPHSTVLGGEGLLSLLLVDEESDAQRS
jgi:hypothetical protein